MICALTFPESGNFSYFLQNIVIRTSFCTCQRHSCSIYIHIKYNEVHKIRKPRRFFQISTSHLSFHMGSRLCFFPPIFMSFTHIDEKVPICRCAQPFPGKRFLPSFLYQDLFELSLPSQPSEGGPYKFLTRGTTASSILCQVVWPSCNVVDASICQDIQT